MHSECHDPVSALHLYHEISHPGVARKLSSRSRSSRGFMGEHSLGREVRDVDEAGEGSLQGNIRIRRSRDRTSRHSFCRTKFYFRVLLRPQLRAVSFGKSSRCCPRSPKILLAQVYIRILTNTLHSIMHFDFTIKKIL